MKLWIRLKSGKTVAGDYPPVMLAERLQYAMNHPEVSAWKLERTNEPKA